MEAKALRAVMLVAMVRLLEECCGWFGAHCRLLQLLLLVPSGGWPLWQSNHPLLAFVSPVCVCVSVATDK